MAGQPPMSLSATSQHLPAQRAEPNAGRPHGGVTHAQTAHPPIAATPPPGRAVPLDGKQHLIPK